MTETGFAGCTCIEQCEEVHLDRGKHILENQRLRARLSAAEQRFESMCDEAAKSHEAERALAARLSAAREAIEDTIAVLDGDMASPYVERAQERLRRALVALEE